MTSIVAGFLALGARSPLAFALAVAPTQRTVSLSPNTLIALDHGMKNECEPGNMFSSWRARPAVGVEVASVGSSGSGGSGGSGGRRRQ